MLNAKRFGANDGLFVPRDDSPDPVVVIMKLAAEGPDGSFEVNNLISLVAQPYLVEVAANALILEEKVEADVSLPIGFDQLAEGTVGVEVFVAEEVGDEPAQVTFVVGAARDLQGVVFFSNHCYRLPRL